ncbi:MAG: hypothetical protein ABMA13_23455 [Chthoniobacteraceae bacterium]
MEHFHARARQALKLFEEQSELRAAVADGVDAFFQRNPDLARTEETAGFIASLIHDHLCAEADSQSAGAPEANTKKVAA